MSSAKSFSWTLSNLRALRICVLSVLTDMPRITPISTFFYNDHPIKPAALSMKLWWQRLMQLIREHQTKNPCINSISIQKSFTGWTSRFIFSEDFVTDNPISDVMISTVFNFNNEVQMICKANDMQHWPVIKLLIHKMTTPYMT